MAQQRTPFDRIEGSLEYIGLLRETIQTTEIEIQKRLGRHIDTSHRLLNDLRTLRRLLLDER